MANTLIGQEKDRQDITVKIYFSSTLGDSPVMSHFMRGYADLIDSGHAGPFLVGTNRSRAIYLEIENKLVGYVVYDIHEDIPKTTWIIHGSINSEYRRRGLYTIINKYLEDQARKMGSKRVVSLVHTDNTAMLELGKAIGRNIVYHRLEKDLSQSEE